MGQAGGCERPGRQPRPRSHGCTAYIASCCGWQPAAARVRCRPGSRHPSRHPYRHARAGAAGPLDPAGPCCWPRSPCHKPLAALPPCCLSTLTASPPALTLERLILKCLLPRLDLHLGRRRRCRWRRAAAHAAPRLGCRRGSVGWGRRGERSERGAPQDRHAALVHTAGGAASRFVGAITTAKQQLRPTRVGEVGGGGLAAALLLLLLGRQRVGQRAAAGA